jgi:4-diphosphocytidyl-2-C-methyl-D-erythritol kinase
MIFTAPAKINLYLKVLSKRDDGYHEIETLFERISIFDELSIEPSKDSTLITCDDPRVPTDEGSLLGRTVKAFKRAIKEELNYKINLKKNIPIAAGLGGGSSDSASLLKGMNELAGFPLTEGELYNIASGLGADIPFFVSGKSFAYGRGRGDIIQGIESPLKMWHVLVAPPLEVPTKDIYKGLSAFSLTNNKGIDRIFTAFLNKADVSGIMENLYNDLQTVTLQDFPTVKDIFSALEKEGAGGVLLSGSGPVVFGIFSHEEAIRAADSLRQTFPDEENWKIFIANTY